MLCASTRPTTRSFARANDANIVRKTEESAESKVILSAHNLWRHLARPHARAY